MDEEERLYSKQQAQEIIDKAIEEKNAEELPKPKEAFDGRRAILYIVVGGYLIYLSYKLLTSFAGTYPLEGWTTNMIISLAGGVVFAIVGVFLLVRTAILYVKRNREMNETGESENE